MLKHLSIKNIAVIEKSDIDFKEGFSVLTGETGAGKSIIIDAINMLCGERVSKGIIRNGEEFARVDGEFETDDITSKKIADILGTDCENEIIISRQVNIEGKNTIRINGIPANTTMLKSVGELLVNIHGQHDNTSLLSVKTHIGFLDMFGSAEILPVLEKYRLINHEYGQTKKALESINTNEQEKLRRRDILSFQKNEIEDADLKLGEDIELEQRKTVLDNTAKITENTRIAYEMLYGSEESTAHDLLWSAISKLEKVAEFDARLSDIFGALSDIGYGLDEKVRELKDYCDMASFDESEADRIEERLEVIYTLKRKYGNSVEAILKFYENACNELDDIDSGDEKIAALKRKLSECDSARKVAAQKLTDLRKKYGKILSEKIMCQLGDLNMAKVLFGVEITDGEYRENGACDVEFMVCTNVGEEKKPLAKIASGGELSRIMLAIKSVLAGYDNMKTVIFDEIDSGVSGNAARKIGEKLFSMSENSQVLCITHLPQISALADNHYLIQKSVVSGRTLTDVRLLDENDRIDEIARTLGGASITDIARENARQLLNEANLIRKNK